MKRYSIVLAFRKCKLRSQWETTHNYQNSWNRKVTPPSAAKNTEKLNHSYCCWECKMSQLLCKVVCQFHTNVWNVLFTIIMVFYVAFHIESLLIKELIHSKWKVVMSPCSLDSLVLPCCPSSWNSWPPTMVERPFEDWTTQ